MRKYEYGINSYHKAASIHVEIGPWFAFLIKYIIDKICDFFHLTSKSIPKSKDEQDFISTKEYCLVNPPERIKQEILGLNIKSLLKILTLL
jgi:hypothetical protein